MTRAIKPASSSALRFELSHRNRVRASRCTAEMSYRPVPSIIYAENEAGEHGNFLTASYKRILHQPGWKARLAKVIPARDSFPEKQIAGEASSNARTAPTRC